MLNHERICEMTRLAIFDQKDGQECKPMVQYFRKDYIAKEMIKSIVTGTAAFFLLAVMAAIYDTQEVMGKISSMGIRQILIGGIFCYALYMAGYLLITYAVYHVRYTAGRQKVKNYYQHLKKVNKIYREEDQI